MSELEIRRDDVEQVSAALQLFERGREIGSPKLYSRSQAEEQTRGDCQSEVEKQDSKINVR